MNSYFVFTWYSWPYFVTIALFIGILIGVAFLASKLKQKTVYWLIFGIYAFNFLLHFLKLTFPANMDIFPKSLAKIFPVNLCAVLMIASPFLYLSKWKIGRDYLCIIGFVSGLLALAFRAGDSTSHFDFGTLDGFLEGSRYLLSHFLLMVASILMLNSGIHVLSYKRAYALPLLFMAASALNAGSAIYLFYKGYIGIVDANGHLTQWGTKEGWMALIYRNSGWGNEGFAFGPDPKSDVALLWLYRIMIPYLQTYRYQGLIYFTPVIWEAIPLYLVIYPLTTLFCLCFPKSRREVNLATMYWKQRLSMRRNRR